MKVRNFRNRVAMFVSVVLLVVLFASTAFAARRNFTFVNYSGRTISYLYIRWSGFRDWTSDLLGNSVLSSGDSVGLWYNNKHRYFDVYVVFSDGESQSFSWHDFQSMRKLTIFRRGSTYYIRNN